MRIKDWDHNLRIRLLGETSFNVIFWIFYPFLSIYFAQSFGKSLTGYKVIATDRVFLLFIVAGVLLAQTFMQLDLLFPVFLKDTVHSTTILAFGDWNLQLSGEKLFGLIVSENGLFGPVYGSGDQMDASVPRPVCLYRK